MNNLTKMNNVDSEVEDKIFIQCVRDDIVTLPAIQIYYDEDCHDAIGGVIQNDIVQISDNDDVDNLFEDCGDQTVICGRAKIKGSLKNKKFKRVVDVKRLQNRLQNEGFKTKTLMSGQFLSASKELSGKQLKQFKQYVIDAMINRKQLEAQKYKQLLGGDSDNAKFIFSQTDRKQNLVIQHFSNNIQKLLSNIEQIQGGLVKYSISTDGVDSDRQIKHTASNIENLIKKLTDFIKKYRTTEEIKNIGDSLQVNVVIPRAKLQSQKIKQSMSENELFNIYKYIHKFGYRIISPKTDSLCVPYVKQYIHIMKEEIDKFYFLRNILKKRSEAYAKKMEIQNGATMEQIKQIFADEFVFDSQGLISSLDAQLFEQNKMDYFVLIQGGHCMLAVSQLYEPGMKLYEKMQTYLAQNQSLMKAYNPNIAANQKQTKKSNPPINIMSMDFEWFREVNTSLTQNKINKFNKQQKKSGSADPISQIEQNVYDEIPYAAGFCYNMDGQYVYHQIVGIDDFYTEVIDYIITAAYIMSDCAPNAEGFTLNVLAHYMFFADMPIIQKKLLEDPRLEKRQGIQSGSSKIIAPYKIVDTDIIIQFIDFKNYIGKSLDDILKMFGLEIQKGEFPHDIITRDNYMQVCKDYDLNKYLYNDTVGLLRAFEAWRKKWIDMYQIDILRERVYTQSSIAQKVFFKHFYENNIYHQNADDEQFCKEGYYGGMTEIFYRGEQYGIESIDINSSYPGQCVNHLFPTGPYSRQNFNMLEYTGQPLKYGIYSVFVQSTPKDLKYPCIPVKHDGKLKFPILSNYTVKITHAEVLKAYQQGYKLFLMTAVVSENVSQPLANFMTDLYKQRNEYKSMMKDKALAASYSDNNINQELCKLLMNGLTGKFGWAAEHEISDCTDDYNLIIKLALQNKLLDITELTDRYVKYSAITTSNTSRTNFPLIAYITAYGRLQLIDMIEKLQQSNCHVLYCDTDSVYFSRKTDNYDNDKFKQLVEPELDGSTLGKWKLEMADNVGQDVADSGIFVTVKMYALKGQKKEKIMGKGIARWLIDNSEKAIKRRSQIGAQQITYDSYRSFLNDDDTKQQLNVKTYQISSEVRHLLTENKDNIKTETVINKVVKGRITKRLVKGSGKCVPMQVVGDFVAPERYVNEHSLHLYQTLEQMTDDLQLEVNEIADQYPTFRNEKTNQYYVFIDKQTAIDYINKQEITNFHQIFGNNMRACFDIDNSTFHNDQQYRANTLREIQLLVDSINQHYGVKHDWSIIDRSRDSKISYHVRAPYQVKRIEFRVLVQDIIKKHHELEDAINPLLHIIDHIDLAIYRLHGSLRVSDLNNINDQYAMLQTNLGIKTTNALVSKLYIDEQKKIQQKRGVKSHEHKQLTTAAVDYIRNKPELKGWQVTDNIRKYKNCTKMYLRRTANCQSYCDQCKKEHEHDNTMYLTFLGKTITHACWKSAVEKTIDPEKQSFKKARIQTTSQRPTKQSPPKSQAPKPQQPKPQQPEPQQPECQQEPEYEESECQEEPEEFILDDFE